jgi:hypothetical protein
MAVFYHAVIPADEFVAVDCICTSFRSFAKRLDAEALKNW